MWVEFGPPIPLICKYIYTAYRVKQKLTLSDHISRLKEHVPFIVAESRNR